MRTSAIVLGVLGGALGTVFGFSVAIAGMQEAWLTAYLPLGGLAVAAGLAGLVGAALVRSHRRPSRVLLGTAGAVLLVVISVSHFFHPIPHLWLWYPVGILLILAAGLTFGRRHEGGGVK